MKTFLHSSKDKQSLSDWSLRQKAGFFVFLALFAICIGMACFFNGFSLPNLLILIAIAIVSMVIYVLPISLHPVVKAVITIILPTAAFFLLESMTHVVWETMEIDAVLLNLVFYYLFFLFFFFVSGSTKISLDILLIFTMIVGLANYFVILFRSSPILPWDLANNYTFSITYLVAQLASGFLGCIILAGKCNLHFPALSAKKTIRGLIRLALCCVLIIPSACYVHFLYQPDIADYTSLDNTLFTPKYMFKTNGFFVAFLMDSRYLRIDEPNGYSKEYAYAATLADRFEFGKASLYAALQYRDTETESASGAKVSKDSLNPTFAIAYKPVENLSVYASYAQSYTKPVEVSKSYDNAGEIFKPIKNKQTEVGIKYRGGEILHSLAFFELNQGSYIKEDNPGGKIGEIYTQNGENKFKGVEYSLTGKVAPKWNVMGGLMYLDGKREKLAKGSEHLEGRYATGTPKWNAVLATEYEADQNNSAIFRMNYVGKSHVNDNCVMAPDYMTFDLGYKHKTKINSTPVTLTAMCYNVLGKDYWISRGTSVALGAPRTMMLSAQFDI